MPEPTPPEQRPPGKPVDDYGTDGGHRRDISIDDLFPVTDNTGTQDRTGFDGGSATPPGPLVPPKSPQEGN